MEEKKLTGYPSIDKPWLKYYSEEAINAPLPECTMYEYIWKRNQDNLGRTAINYYGTNISYGNFFKKVSEVASALENIGVKAGDMVTVCMINSPETVCLTFALNKIGATANMVYGASTPEEIKTQVNDVHSKVVFTLDLFQSKFAEIIDQTEIDTVVIGTMTQSMSVGMKIGARLFKGMKRIPLPSDKRFISWKGFLCHASGNSSMCHDPNAAAIITYTGGTTGGSKGVLLSNKAVIAVAQQYVDGESCLKRESTWAQVLPLFIAYGVTCSLLIPMAVGMTLIIRIPMSESIADICKTFKPNHIMYGPAYWEAFADSEQDIDVSYLLAPISGGDTIHAVTEDKINKYLKEHGSSYPILNGYGMTEVGAAVSVSMTRAYRARSVGIPFAHNIISAFDVDTGKELPYGVDGELCIHTPSAMLGYVNQPEETANIMRKHEDGLMWVHTGDLGHIDEDGFVFISGRLKRYMLHISDGLQKKVFSLDIERVLLQHPAVKNCVVVPINDRVHNQVPVAFILPQKDVTPTDELLEEIKQFCEENLDQYHHPVKYHYLEKVPLTKVGKVDYRTLEKEAEQENLLPSK